MNTYGLQLGAWDDRHRLTPWPANTATGFSERSKGYTAGTPAYSIDEMARVLRLLIERFGGEATSAAMIKHTILQRRSMPGRESDTALRFWLGGILDELEGCGAITVEDNDQDEVIARIAPHGVVLAYQ
ncbi:MAG: hypothetical protein H7274_02955 [Rhodoferax sp.]|nr:hypothetical protein [Rhodoferax sp.]